MTPDIESIAALARQGKTSREIGNILKCGKNAVLGRVHRAGLKLGDLNGWAARPAAAGSRSRARPQSEHKKRGNYHTGPRPLGHIHSTIADATRIAALALRLTGQSRMKVAKAFGVNDMSVRNWELNPYLMERAQVIADRALSETRAVAKARAEEATRLKAERAAAVAAHNAPILATLKPRTRAICEHYLNGNTLGQIGTAFGITRERVRQIMGPALVAGLDTSLHPRGGMKRAFVSEYVPRPRAKKVKGPDGRTLPWSDQRRAAASEAMRARLAAGFKPKGGRPKGVKDKVVRRSYSLPPEERARRSARMKAMWAKVRGDDQ